MKALELMDLLTIAALSLLFLNLNFFSFCMRPSSTVHTFRLEAWEGGRRGEGGREGGRQVKTWTGVVRSHTLSGCVTN